MSRPKLTPEQRAGMTYEEYLDKRLEGLTENEIMAPLNKSGQTMYSIGWKYKADAYINQLQETLTPEEQARMSKEDYVFKRFQGMSNEKIARLAGIKASVFKKIGWSQEVNAQLRSLRDKKAYQAKAEKRRIQNEKEKAQKAERARELERLANQPSEERKRNREIGMQLRKQWRDEADPLRFQLENEFGKITEVPDDNETFKQLRKIHARYERAIKHLGVWSTD